MKIWEILGDAWDFTADTAQGVGDWAYDTSQEYFSDPINQYNPANLALAGIGMAGYGVSGLLGGISNTTEALSTPPPQPTEAPLSIGDVLESAPIPLPTPQESTNAMRAAGAMYDPNAP